MVTNQGTYSRRSIHNSMWLAFDRLAARMNTSTSALLAEAAREYLDRHKDDEKIEIPDAAPGRSRHQAVVDFDPFAPENLQRNQQKGASF